MLRILVQWAPALVVKSFLNLHLVLIRLLAVEQTDLLRLFRRELAALVKLRCRGACVSFQSLQIHVFAEAAPEVSDQVVVADRILDVRWEPRVLHSLDALVALSAQQDVLPQRIRLKAGAGLELLVRVVLYGNYVGML